ncbi:MAG: isocitrate lyase/PEP mutase family protein [Candidatus Hodarchaeales archaeon]|jgi:methylisocitrate lyase
MMRNMPKLLRESLQQNDIIVAPGCWDPLTAKIVEDLGFPAVYLGGYAFGASSCNTEPLTTLTEISSHAHNIVSNVNIPLIVDGGAGFGDPVHTYRTIRVFVSLGISSIHIEDQVYPKRVLYHAGIKEITDKALMVEKIKAAVEARNSENSDFYLIARTDAGRDQRRKLGEGPKEIIDRLNAYFEAGADMGMCFPEDEEETKLVAREIDGPLCFVNSERMAFRPTVQQMPKLGYKLVIYPNTITVVIAKYAREAYAYLKEHGNTDILDADEVKKIRQDIQRLIGLDKLYKFESTPKT